MEDFIFCFIYILMKKQSPSTFFILYLFAFIFSSFSEAVGQDTQSKILKDSIESVSADLSKEEILQLFDKLKTQSIEEEDFDMLSYALLSSIYYKRKLGDKHGADQTILEVFDLVEKHEKEISLIRRIYAHRYMEGLYKDRRNLKASNTLIKEYIELEKEFGFGPDELAISYLELSASYRTMGNFQNALEFANKALDLCIAFDKTSEKPSLTNKIEIATTYQFIGLVNKDLKKYKEAISNYKTSLSYIEGKEFSKNRRATNLKIRGYTRLLNATNLILDLDESKEAIQKLKVLGQKSDHFKYEVHELEGTYLILTKDYQRAIVHLKKALEMAKEKFKDDYEFPVVARQYMRIADYYVAVDSLTTALEYYQMGLQYFDNELSSNPVDNPRVEEILEAPQALRILEKKAAISEQIFQNSADTLYDRIATNAYMTSVLLLDQMKLGFINEGSKFYVAEKALPIYNKTIDILFNKYLQNPSGSTINDIFNIMEKNKAGILFENIESKYKLLASSLPQELIDQELNLKNDISYYSKILSQSKNSQDRDEEALKEVQNALFAVKENYALNTQKIKDEYPSFYTFKNDINRIINITEIKDNLSDDEQFIEYYQGEKYLYIFSTTKKASKLRRVPLSSIQNLVEEYYASISVQPNQSMTDLRSFTENAFTLANTILLPELKSNISKISIVTDGILNNIPFESLITNLDESNFLIESVNVSYYYAAKQWNEKHNIQDDSEIELLCLAPEFHTSEESNLARDKNTLTNLPYAKEEMDFLKQNFKGKFIGSDHTSKSDLTSNIGAYDVIHLATHAGINPADPLLSQIHFTDGYLTNYDIQNLNVRPELVVLSACNTAAGEIKSGEGLISLSRGFFEAGVKSLQASLWEINDYSAYQLVKSMYTNLKFGKTKSESLRLAKLDYLKSADKLRSHPYYWAGLIHIGDDQPLYYSSSNKLPLYFTVLGLFILGLLFLVLKKKKSIAQT